MQNNYIKVDDKYVNTNKILYIEDIRETELYRGETFICLSIEDDDRNGISTDNYTTEEIMNMVMRAEATAPTKPAKQAKKETSKPATKTLAEVKDLF